MKNIKNILVKLGVILGTFALVFSFVSPASAAITLGALTVTSDGALTIDGAAASAIAIGSTTTTGNIAIGGALTTGTLTLGGSMVYTPAVSPLRDVFELGASGNNATLRVFSDNLTAFAIKGLQLEAPQATVNSYSGIFTNADYSTIGTLDTRFITGGNVEMDVQLQSANALLLVAQDGAMSNGVIKLMAETGIEIHPRYTAEALSPKRLVIDRADTSTSGTDNTSQVTVGANSGALLLNYGSTTGGVAFPSMTAVQRDALNATAVEGEVIFNDDTNKLNFWTGAAWEAVTSG